MYEITKYIFVGMIPVLGLIMFLMPEKSTKAQLRDDENAVAKTRKNGFILIIVGLIVLAGTFFINQMV